MSFSIDYFMFYIYLSIQVYDFFIFLTGLQSHQEIVRERVPRKLY